MLSLSCAVMAHQARRENVEQLQTALGRDVTVVYDTRPPSSDPDQRWVTGRRAWVSFDSSADYHVVLQDDALVCRDFLAGMSAALEYVDDRTAVTAYVGRGRPKIDVVKHDVNQAVADGRAWVKLGFMYWGVAVVLPTDIIKPMVAWGDRRKRMNYDTRVGRYLRDNARWKTWGTIPSLVEHAEGPSLVGHDRPGRVAYQFLEGSALEVDWSKTPVSKRRAGAGAR